MYSLNHWNVNANARVSIKIQDKRWVLRWRLKVEMSVMCRMSAGRKSQIQILQPRRTQYSWTCWWTRWNIITFRVSRRRREMYNGHARLPDCASVYLSEAACPHYCTYPDVIRGVVGMPLVVQYWADLQSVHVLRCYSNITPTWNVSEYMSVIALCLVVLYSATN